MMLVRTDAPLCQCGGLILPPPDGICVHDCKGERFAKGHRYTPGCPCDRCAAERAPRPSTEPIPDPVCAKACGGCHWCRRAKDGPDYPTLGAVWPVAPAPARAPRAARRKRGGG